MRRRWMITAAEPASITPSKIIAHSVIVGTGVGTGTKIVFSLMGS